MFLENMVMVTDCSQVLIMLITCPCLKDTTCYCLERVNSSKEFYGVCDGKCPGNQADECGSTNLVTVYIGKVGNG